MNIDFNKRLVCSPETLVSVVGGESVLLNLTNEQYFGLDHMGTEMWTALTSSESIQVAYDALLEAYDVDATLLKDDLEAFLENLLTHGLVEYGDS